MLWLIIIIILLSIFGVIALSIGCQNLTKAIEHIIENQLGRKLDDIVRQLNNDNIEKQLNDIVRQLDDIRRLLKEKNNNS